MRINLQNLWPILTASVASLLIYWWAVHQLGGDFNWKFILLLAVPSAIYAWFYRKTPAHNDLESDRTAIYLLSYALAYCAGIYFLPVLGASVMYWAVQFLLPVLILRLCGEKLSAIQFRWRSIFSDFRIIALSFVILLPILIFSVRDSAEIISLFQTWKILIYLPLSILFMVVAAAFWEEFFFRGVVMQSILKLSSSPSLAIFASALLFGTYHIPMRYLNERSPYYNDLLQSIAATLNEQFMMGIVMGIVVYKSRNVWHGIWLHSFFNGVSFIFKLSQMLRL